MLPALLARRRVSVATPPAPQQFTLYPTLAPTASIPLYVTRVIGAPPAEPVQAAATTSTAGGTIATGVTRFYKVTSFNRNGGESLPSNQQSVLTGAGATNSNTVSWAAVPNAVRYRVYYGVATNAQLHYFDVIGGASTSFVDTGALPHSSDNCREGCTVPTVQAPASVTRAQSAVWLANGQVTPSNINLVRVRVNTGAGLVERAVRLRGIGTHDDGVSYRSLLVAVECGAAIPNYKGIDVIMYADYGTERTTAEIAATNIDPVYVFPAVLEIGTARTVADLPAFDFLGATSGYTDPVTREVPQLWKEQLRYFGMTDGSILPVSPDWTSKCGAHDPVATRAESESPAFSDANMATLARRNNRRFELIMRDWWGSGVQLGANRNGYQFMERTIRVQAFWRFNDMRAQVAAAGGIPIDPVKNLYNPNRSAGSNGPYSDETPPTHGMWRFVTGGSSGGTASFDAQYYDPGQIFGEWYAMTADATMAALCCMYAKTYQYYERWADNGTQVQPYRVSPIWIHQPRGQAFHHSLTGDPETLEIQQTVADVWYNDARIGELGSEGTPVYPSKVRDYAPGTIGVGGEERPVSRVVMATLGAHCWSRPLSEGLAANLGGAILDWGTDLQNKVLKVYSTGASWKQMPGAPAGVNAYSKDDGASAYVNTFFASLVAATGQQLVQRARISNAAKNAITARVKEMLDNVRLYLFEEDSADNPTQGGSNAYYGVLGQFKNYFLGQPEYDLNDVTRYRPSGMDVNGFYGAPYLWVGWQRNDPTSAAFGRRLYEYGIGDTNGNDDPFDNFDGVAAPYMAAQTPKQSREQWYTALLAPLWAKMGPAPGALPGDTFDHVRLSPSRSSTYPNATAAVRPGGSIQLFGAARCANRRHLKNRTQPTVALTSGVGNVTFTSFWNAFSGTLVVTVTGVNENTSAVFTITDPDSGLTSTCTVSVRTVASVQLSAASGNAPVITGAAYDTPSLQFTASARDALGNLLMGRDWAESSTASFSVAPADQGRLAYDRSIYNARYDKATGLFYCQIYRYAGHPAGTYNVTVTCEGVSATFTVTNP